MQDFIGALGEAIATGVGTYTGNSQLGQQMIQESRQRRVVEKAKQLGIDYTKPNPQFLALAVDEGLMTPQDAALLLAQFKRNAAQTAQAEASTEAIKQETKQARRLADLQVESIRLENQIKLAELESKPLMKDLLESRKNLVDSQIQLNLAHKEGLIKEQEILGLNIKKLNQELSKQEDLDKFYEEIRKTEELTPEQIIKTGLMTKVISPHDLMQYLDTGQKIQQLGTQNLQKAMQQAWENGFKTIETIKKLYAPPEIGGVATQISKNKDLDTQAVVEVLTGIEAAMATALPQVVVKYKAVDPMSMQSLATAEAFQKVLEKIDPTTPDGLEKAKVVEEALSNFAMADPVLDQLMRQFQAQVIEQLGQAQQHVQTHTGRVPDRVPLSTTAKFYKGLGEVVGKWLEALQSALRPDQEAIQHPPGTGALNQVEFFVNPFRQGGQ